MQTGRVSRPVRIGTEFDAVYYFKGKAADGRVIDLSTGGLAMEVRQFFVEGDLIRITFKLPAGDGEQIDFWGIVKHVSGSTIGVSFEEISTETMDAILRYVGNTIILKKLSPHEN